VVTLTLDRAPKGRDEYEIRSDSRPRRDRLDTSRPVAEQRARELRCTGPEVKTFTTRSNRANEALEERDVIQAYRAEINLSALGRGLQVYLRVVVQPKDYSRFKQAVEAMEEIFECHHVTGAESFVLRAAVEGRVFAGTPHP